MVRFGVNCSAQARPRATPRLIENHQQLFGEAATCVLSRSQVPRNKKLDETNKLPVMATSGLTPPGRVSAAAAAKEAI